jgi:phospholipid transport system substrate-binding protein
MEVVKGPIDEIARLLKDPKYAGAAQKNEQWDMIWAQIDKIFDFDAIAKLALGRNRRMFKPEEMQSFTQVFKEFIGYTYLNRIEGNYQDLKIEFHGEEMLPKNKAIVKTTAMRGETSTPVDYKLRNKAGKWLIYDVLVEGISLIKNYRTQFDQLLTKKSPQELISQIEAKAQKLKQGDKSAG